jgi:hypothetical protein
MTECTKPLENRHKMTCRDYSAYEPTIDVDCAKSLLSTPVPPGEQESALARYSPLNASRKPPKAGSSAQLVTLSDVMSRVESSPDLGAAKKRDVLSALRRLADCVGKPPEQVSASPKTLQREVAAVNYHTVGLSKTRWTNIKSLSRKALQTAGINIMPGRRRNSVFSPAWAHLRAQCCASHQMGSSRIMNYCSANGIEPDAVDEAVFSRFEEELTNNSLELDSRRIYRETRRIWDKAAETVPDWPAFRTGAATRPRGYSRPWTAYPRPFLDDVEAFLARGSAEYADIDLDDDMPMLQPATIKGRRIALRLLAHAAAETCIPIENLTGLRFLVEPECAKAILQFFMRRNGGKSSESIYGHASLLRTIAKYWAKADRGTIDALNKYCKKTATKQRGMTDRNKELLRQFDEPANVQAIYSLPAKLMKLARSAEKNSEAAFNHATYAVAIEILLRAPLRIENLHSLSIAANIIMPTDLRDGEIILTVPHYAVKNDQNLEHALPPEFGRMIREYLAEFRFGATVSSPWLFPNERGDRRNKDAFAQQIKKVVFRHTGITANVHLYRGLMVKMYQQAFPHDMETPSKMLGHTSTRTTARAYSEGKATAGQRAFSQIIEAKREQVEFAREHRRRH